MAVVSTNEPMTGLTWFLRCGDCHEMYVPTEGLNWKEGTTQVYWVKPHPVRKPAKCDHSGPVERWDGTAWVEAAITR